MKASGVHKTALSGIGLIVAYCAVATGVDGVAKIVAQDYAAPQLFCVSGFLVALMSCATNRVRAHRCREVWRVRPNAPRLVALRSCLFILSCLCYFTAFQHLPFAQVFLFIGLAPIIAALLSGPLLGEKLRMQSWIALGVGLFGVVLMYARGSFALNWGDIAAACAVVTGASSMVLARLISRYEPNALLQVLYPNLALGVTMLCALPFVFKPMPLSDVALMLSYAGLLFLARWILVLALARLKAYVATPLMNLQFVFMVALGWLYFGEVPDWSLILGASVVIAAGTYLALEQVLDWSKFPRARRAAMAQSVPLFSAGLPHAGRRVPEITFRQKFAPLSNYKVALRNSDL